MVKRARAGTAERIGAIDVGSNSVKLLVADVDGAALAEVARRGRVTRLARGLVAGHRPQPAAVSATRAALERSVAEAERIGAARIVGAATGGLRLAPDPAELAAGLGHGLLELPVLNARTEACLSVLGLRAGSGWPLGVVCLDLGGASTEVSRVTAGAIEELSLAAGAVTMTERFLRSDPPAAAELAALAGHLETLSAELPPAPPPPSASAGAATAARPAGRRPAELLGVGGTLTALACLALGVRARHADRIHGVRLEWEQLDGLSRRLAALPVAARQERLGISSGRADILVAGAWILRGIAAHYGRAPVRVSAWGLRHGLAIAASALGRPRFDPAAIERLALAAPAAIRRMAAGF